MKARGSVVRRPVSLFDRLPEAQETLDIRTRLANFARAAGRRHRRTRAGTDEFVTALRGYHGTLAVAVGVPIPRLDEALTAFATAEYARVRFTRHPPAARLPAPVRDRTPRTLATSQTRPVAP